MKATAIEASKDGRDGWGVEATQGMHGAMLVNGDHPKVWIRIWMWL